MKQKKNIETDMMGDKLGRIHLGKQDLSELQTRKMKGLKRSRGLEEDNGSGVFEQEEEDNVSQSEDDDGGIEIDGQDDLSEGGSSGGASGDEIDIRDNSDAEPDVMPKRQRIA